MVVVWCAALFFNKLWDITENISFDFISRKMRCEVKMKFIFCLKSISVFFHTTFPRYHLSNKLLWRVFPFDFLYNGSFCFCRWRSSVCLLLLMQTVPNKENGQMHHFLLVIEDFFSPGKSKHTPAAYSSRNVNSCKLNDYCSTSMKVTVQHILCKKKKNHFKKSYSRQVEARWRDASVVQLLPLLCETEHVTSSDSHTLSLFIYLTQLLQ